MPGGYCVEQQQAAKLVLQMTTLLEPTMLSSVNGHSMVDQHALKAQVQSLEAQLAMQHLYQVLLSPKMPMQMTKPCTYLFHLYSLHYTRLQTFACALPSALVLLHCLATDC